VPRGRDASLISEAIKFFIRKKVKLNISFGKELISSRTPSIPIKKNRFGQDFSQTLRI
jgi:hypothetical protein